MAGKKRVDPVKQREKRAKIAAAVGAVLFLLVAAVEVPSILKMMHPKPVVPPPTNVANPDGSLPSGATAGTTATTTTPTGETADGQLADTDVPPADATGQLVAFDVFQTKDPFRPQVTSSPASDSSTSSSTPASPTPAPATPTATTPAVTTPATTTPAPTTTTPTSPLPTAVPSTPTPGSTATPTVTTPTRPTVAISVNGTVSRISTGGVFPSGSPVFRLVSWTKGEARIGIVGGSYATGDQTLPLTLGKSVTLQNTSDGKQYKLLLVSTP